jgi:hypothetical protein
MTNTENGSANNQSLNSSGVLAQVRPRKTIRIASDEVGQLLHKAAHVEAQTVAVAAVQRCQIRRTLRTKMRLETALPSPLRADVAPSFGGEDRSGDSATLVSAPLGSDVDIEAGERVARIDESEGRIVFDQHDVEHAGCGNVEAPWRARGSGCGPSWSVLKAADDRSASDLLRII